MDSPWVKAAAVAAGSYLAWSWLDSNLLLSHDVAVLRRLLPTQTGLNSAVANNDTWVDSWNRTWVKFPKKKCIIFEGRSYTFAEVEKISNQMAHWALSQGVKKGDAVAMYLENCPEYIFTWLGLTKIGAVVAMLNHNLTGKGLLHCAKLSNSNVFIFGANCAERIGPDAEGLRELGMTLWSQSGIVPFAQCMDSDWLASKSEPIPKEARSGIGMTDTFGYIYTSGTTGLPKAAVVKHARMFAFGSLMFNSYELNAEDRIYCCLPLYHSAANLGVGAMVIGGCTIVLARKFSATNFWEDVAKNKATVIQYIGELCRYLLNTPKSPFERKHRVRIAIGNGLRPDIWTTFQERFNIPTIGEFYGATEGNISFVNLCTTPEDRGACGRAGWLLKKVLGYKIAKFDVEKDEPARGKDGRLEECPPGEAGELLGVIKDTIVNRFEGYTNPEATKKKVLDDAFAQGDKYFRTGDLMMQDARGYIYFVDRIGDTFRWKGENVSTTEVAEAVSLFPGVKEANVYGTQVPGKDGRACTVALVADEASFDFVKFYKHVKKELPTYARPVFVRFLPAMDITGTFKHQKVKLRNEGVDPANVSDPLYMINTQKKTYEPMDQNVWGSVVAGKAKL